MGDATNVGTYDFEARAPGLRQDIKLQIGDRSSTFGSQDYFYLQIDLNSIHLMDANDILAFIIDETLHTYKGHAIAKIKWSYSTNERKENFRCTLKMVSNIAQKG